MSIIHALLRWALGLLALGTGKRREPQRPDSPAPSSLRPETLHSPATAPHRPPHRSSYDRHIALDGHATALVRPYLLAHDQQHAQLRRRLALVLAADFGIDLDQHIVGATVRAA